MRKSPAVRSSGFSLVEVVLAVGVVAFAFVAILGLIPAGMGQFRQAIDNSESAQIAQRVMQDAEQTDFETLVDYKNTNTLAQNSATNGQPYYFRAPSLQYSQASTPQSPGACIRYFDESGNEIIPAGRQGSAGGNPMADPTQAELKSAVYYVNTRILVATGVGSSTGGLSYTPDLATVVVQVAYNPGNRPIPITNCMFDVSNLPGLTVRSYTAQVGRNF